MYLIDVPTAHTLQASGMEAQWQQMHLFIQTQVYYNTSQVCSSCIHFNNKPGLISSNVL